MKTTLFSLLTLFFIGLVNAGTIIVSNKNDAGVGSLRAAVDSAQNADTIRFHPNLIANGSATILLDSTIIVDKSLTFIGLYNSTDTLFINGNNVTNIFYFDYVSKVVMDSLVFINGYAQQIVGGAIYVDYSDSIYISNSIFRNCKSDYDGGAIYIEGDTVLLAITNTKINNNISDYGGGLGLYASFLTMTIDGSEFLNNKSNNDGGAVSIYSNNFSSSVISNSSFNNNTSYSDGGSIYFGGDTSNIVIQNSHFNNNFSSEEGGAIYLAFSTSTLTIDNSTLDENIATDEGGALHIYSYRNSMLNISNSSISKNQANSSGGGIYAYSDTNSISILNTLIDGNQSNYEGGGVYLEYSNYGFSSTINSSISDNIASSNGGGILVYQYNYNNSPLIETIIEVENSTISRNKAYNGGAIYNYNYAYNDTISNIINITNSTISGNTATGYGGFLYSYVYTDTSLTAVTIKNSTISENKAYDEGQSIYFETNGNDSSVVTLESSILWSNDVNIITSNTLEIVSNGYNIFSDSLAGYDVLLDSINVSSASLNLMPLADNGGFSKTMMPGAGSIAINGGNPSDMSSAQNRAILDSRRDVGAAENHCVATFVAPQTACGSFTWIDGITYTSNNTTAQYIVRSTTPNICDSITTLNLTINTIPDASIITSETSIAAVSSGNQYQWVDCDNGYSAIAGATKQFYTSPDNGNYAVIVTANGCADTSTCANITTAGLDLNTAITGVNIYPNPTRNNVTVDLENIQDGQCYLELMDLTGRTLTHQEITTHTSHVSLSDYDGGIYIIRISNGNQQSSFRIIKE